MQIQATSMKIFLLLQINHQLEKIKLFQISGLSVQYNFILIDILFFFKILILIHRRVLGNFNKKKLN